MYQGKHVKRTKYGKKRANRRKATLLLSSLALLIVLLVGTTTAFLIASDGPITNIFNSSKVTCQVKEGSFNGNTKTNVTISNTGDTEAYIRAAIVVTWKDAGNGNVYGSKPVEGTDYTIVMNENDWFLGNDGFWYYKAPVAPKDQTKSVTTALITNCTVIQEKAPAGYGLNVEILGSAIQSVPVKVVEDHWPAVQVINDEPHGNLVKAN